MRCTVWRQLAENLVESVARGARLIVTDRLKQRTFETTEGEKRTVIELDVDEVGPSLRYFTATLIKVPGGQRHGDKSAESAGPENSKSPAESDDDEQPPL
ncbi:single-strand DNA-binding protein [Lentzea jiangxiensis]|uniref:Single-strand DNA-binding protein n=1 Tax=Lentzea jiangxiensis TaxID=641025 RepID=A0A1H0X4B8_9PSEU|nr:single-strand DNA-binding protein [Lentzea jiangxiensis]